MLLRKPIAHIVVNSLGAYILNISLASFVVTGGFWAYVVIGLFVGILNVVVKPILKVVSLPFIFLTLGLFLIVINAVILFVVEYLLQAFQFGEISLAIDGLLTYIVAALILSVVQFFAWKLFK